VELLLSLAHKCFSVADERLSECVGEIRSRVSLTRLDDYVKLPTT
jgi:hypothetical protein